MSRYENERCAAFFDFDGFFFQPGTCWKIQHPRLGRVGSRIPFEEGYRTFLELQKKDPEARLNDFFALDESVYETLSPNEGDNIAPLSQILHFARHHLLRHDDLILITPKGFVDPLIEMTDHVFEQQKNFALIENPFRRAERLYPPQEILPPPDQLRERMMAKIAYYSFHLEHLEKFGTDESDDPSGGIPMGRRYSKIFLFHTERELEGLLKDHLRREREKLASGRNSIVPFYIARLQGES